MRKSWVCYLLCLGVVLVPTLSTGCGGGQKPSCKVPDALVLEIETSDRVNTNEAGQSLPTVLRVYQLTDISALEMASFDDVWTKAEQVLGDTLAGSVEITIFPGQRTVQRLTRNPQAFFIVAAAVFRRPAGTSWRTIQELPPPGDPCAETGKATAGERLKALRVRVYLEDYRIESVSNFRPRPRGSCGPEDPDCIEGVSDSVPDELGPARPGRGLRPFAARPRSKESSDRKQAPSTGRRRRPGRGSGEPAPGDPSGSDSSKATDPEPE